MSVSRRGFLQGLGVDRTHAAAFMAARGHEELVAEAMQQGRQGGARMRPNLPPGVEAIRISSNENPLGPGKAAIDAILGKFPEANRYPFNSTPLDADLEILIAKLNTAKRENVVLGVGSQELLKNAARVFMSPTRHLVIPSPTYGDPAGFAQNALHYTVKSAPVNDKTLKTDLSALLPLVKGAGLVYLCNPNNPTGTINTAQEIKDFVAEVKKSSPTTAILLDEAYCDYASDPSFATAIPTALATPGVIVARTMSKAYGMAGVRIGYAVGDAATIKKMAAYRMPYNVNTFGVAAAVASLKDPQHIKDESARNKTVRDFTTKFFADLGYTSTDSQTNFIFTDIGKTMTAAQFRDACAAKGVMVGRDFPPLEKQWARISLGTMEEMQKATDVFRSVLKPATTTSSGKGQ
ncbi:MAG: histidinol-phosphate aminotransferase family protein [Acidobacteria bacterium]|jgi:histidinol-phosphate aminotransferase|nr:histidinol-phosphate aminotransferase family protein [Acidobacteriota bacterium]